MTPERLSFGGASADAPTEVMPKPNGEVEVEGSLLDSLRKSAKAQQEIHITDLPIGGEFGKRLQIRYQPLEPVAMDRYIARRSEIRELQEADPNRGLPFTEFNMDLMAQACAAVVGADEKGENKVVLADELGPVKLEHRLAELLELPIPGDIELTARDVILALFGGNALAIVDHGDDLLSWLRDPTEQPDVGKSSAPTGSTPSE